jgi:hypothetical protein
MKNLLRCEILVLFLLYRASVSEVSYRSQSTQEQDLDTGKLKERKEEDDGEERDDI